jgi:peroxiredoxin
VLGLSPDAVDECRHVHRQQRLAFPLLSDTELTAARAFGVVHKQGMRGQDIALPANILIDAAGQIRWRHIARRVPDRMSPADLDLEVEEVLHG